MSYEELSAELYRARIKELEDALTLATTKIKTVVVAMSMWGGEDELAQSTAVYLTEALNTLKGNVNEVLDTN